MWKRYLVGAVNQEKALVGAFSMIVKTDGSFAALMLMLQVYPLNRPFYAFDHENGSRPDLSCWVGFVSHFTDKLYR